VVHNNNECDWEGGYNRQGKAENFKFIMEKFNNIRCCLILGELQSRETLQYPLDMVT
jgi:hypothetical protein